MRRGIKRDGVKLGYMADLVHPFGPGVLTGHDIAAQIDGDGVFPVHAAFLAEGLNGALALDRGIELVDPLTEAKSVRILNQRLEDRPRQAFQLRGLEPPSPDGGRCVIHIHDALKPDEDFLPDLFGELGLKRPKVVMLARQHRIEIGLFGALGQQGLDPVALVRIVERIRPAQKLTEPVV